MNKEEVKTEITTIGKRLNKTFIEVSDIIISGGCKPETEKHIIELCREINNRLYREVIFTEFGVTMNGTILTEKNTLWFTVKSNHNGHTEIFTVPIRNIIKINF